MRMRNVIAVGGLLISLALPACASRDEPTIEPGGASPTATATQAVSPSPGGEDVSGNCDEPEHKSDATCQAGAGGEDSSGSGKSEGSGDGGSNSGPGY